MTPASLSNSLFTDVASARRTSCAALGGGLTRSFNVDRAARERQFLQHPVRVPARPSAGEAPASIHVEMPGFGVLAQIDLEDLVQSLLQGGVGDRHRRFDPTVQ